MPALCLTLLLEGVGRLANPTLYAELKDPFRWSHVPLQFFTNLTFTAQCWGYETNPLSNSPFWSLSFECIYYLLFALFFFGAGKSSMRWLIAAVMLVAGPSIVLLFPTWLLGCVLYDAYIWLRDKPHAMLKATAFLVAVMGSVAVLRHPISWTLKAADEAHRTAWLQTVLPGFVRHHFADSSGAVPWLSRFSLSYYLAAVVVFVLMLWALIALDRLFPNVPKPFSETLRWVADGTFSLYLLHLPLLMLIRCVVPGPPRNAALWSVLVIGICILLSRPFDLLKNAMRHTMHRAGPGRPVATSI